MQAQSVLLEPCYRFRLTLPQAQLGRAIGDLRAMSAAFTQEQEEDLAVLTGTVPVAALGDYATTVASYTRGRGRLSCSPGGYVPCRDQEQVVQSLGYDPEADLEHTPDSVFCAHGAGFTVKWQEVPAYMHLESCLRPEVPKRRRHLPGSIWTTGSWKPSWSGNSAPFAARYTGAHLRRRLQRLPRRRRTGESI